MAEATPRPRDFHSDKRVSAVPSPTSGNLCRQALRQRPHEELATDLPVGASQQAYPGCLLAQAHNTREIVRLSVVVWA